MVSTKVTGTSFNIDKFMIDPALFEMNDHNVQPVVESFRHNAGILSPEATQDVNWDLEIAEMLDEHPEGFALSSDDEEAKRLPKHRGRSSRQKHTKSKGVDDFVVFTDSQIFSRKANASRRAAKFQQFGFVPIDKQHKVVSLFTASIDQSIQIADRTKITPATSSANDNHKSKRKIVNFESELEVESGSAEESRPRKKHRATHTALQPKGSKKQEARKSKRRAVESNAEFSNSESDKDFRPRAKQPRNSRNQTHAATKPKKPRKQSENNLAHDLQQPLSEILQHIPEVDIMSFVTRSAEIRQNEIQLSKKEFQPARIKRPLNPFILYRKTFQPRCKELARHNCMPILSKLSGKSWGLESDAVKGRFAKLARLELKNHMKAFPGYKYIAAKPLKRNCSADKDEEEEDDESELSELSG